MFDNPLLHQSVDADVQRHPSHVVAFGGTHACVGAVAFRVGNKEAACDDVVVPEG